MAAWSRRRWTGSMCSTAHPSTPRLRSIRSLPQLLVARIGKWWRRLVDRSAAATLSPLDDLERPWLRRWDFLPKRTAGPGFTRADYAAARARAREVARTTLGVAMYERLERQGYLDVPSRKLPGITYRLRVGRRIEVLCAPGTRSPWHCSYLCINPTYPLPEEEFFAHLYLYTR